MSTESKTQTGQALGCAGEKMSAYMSIKDAVASVDNYMDQFVENSVFNEVSYNREISRLTGWDETTIMMALYNMSEDPEDPYNEKVSN